MLNNRKHIGLNKGFNSTFGVITSGIPPSNTVAPAITGTLEVGQTLTCSDGTWTGTATITYSYQWKRGVTNIGADQNTYVAVYADIGQNITCTVTATNAYGSASQVSNTVVILLTLQSLFNNHAGRNQWAAENSTVVSTTTTWIDYAGIHNVLNPAAANQPTTNSPDADFNNKKSATFSVDDKLQKNTPNYGAGQTTGGIWLVFKTHSNFTATSMLFSVGDNLSNSNYFQIYIGTDGKLNCGLGSSPSTVLKTATVALTVSTKYKVLIEQDGSNINFYINGVLVASTGIATTQWLAYANTLSVLDNIVIGARDFISDVYSNGKIALIGNYPLLTAGNRTDLFTKLDTYYGV